MHTAANGAPIPLPAGYAPAHLARLGPRLFISYFTGTPTDPSVIHLKDDQGVPPSATPGTRRIGRTDSPLLVS